MQDADRALYGASVNAALCGCGFLQAAYAELMQRLYVSNDEGEVRRSIVWYAAKANKLKDLLKPDSEPSEPAAVFRVADPLSPEDQECCGKIWNTVLEMLQPRVSGRGGDTSSERGAAKRLKRAVDKLMMMTKASMCFKKGQQQDQKEQKKEQKQQLLEQQLRFEAKMLCCTSSLVGKLPWDEVTGKGVTDALIMELNWFVGEHVNHEGDEEMRAPSSEEREYLGALFAAIGKAYDVDIIARVRGVCDLFTELTSGVQAKCEAALRGIKDAQPSKEKSEDADKELQKLMEWNGTEWAKKNTERQQKPTAEQVHALFRAVRRTSPANTAEPEPEPENVLHVAQQPRLAQVVRRHSPSGVHVQRLRGALSGVTWGTSAHAETQVSQAVDSVRFGFQGEDDNLRSMLATVVRLQHAGLRTEAFHLFHLLHSRRQQLLSAMKVSTATLCRPPQASLRAVVHPYPAPCARQSSHMRCHDVHCPLSPAQELVFIDGELEAEALKFVNELHDIQELREQLEYGSSSNQQTTESNLRKVTTLCNEAREHLHSAHSSEECTVTQAQDLFRALGWQAHVLAILRTTADTIVALPGSTGQHPSSPRSPSAAQNTQLTATEPVLVETFEAVLKLLSATTRGNRANQEALQELIRPGDRADAYSAVQKLLFCPGAVFKSIDSTDKDSSNEDKQFLVTTTEFLSALVQENSGCTTLVLAADVLAADSSLIRKCVNRMMALYNDSSLASSPSRRSGPSPRPRRATASASSRRPPRSLTKGAIHRGNTSPRALSREQFEELDAVFGGRLPFMQLLGELLQNCEEKSKAEMQERVFEALTRNKSGIDILDNDERTGFWTRKELHTSGGGWDHCKHRREYHVKVLNLLANCADHNKAIAKKLRGKFSLEDVADIIFKCNDPTRATQAALEPDPGAGEGLALHFQPADVFGQVSSAYMHLVEVAYVQQTMFDPELIKTELQQDTAHIRDVLVEGLKLITSDGHPDSALFHASGAAGGAVPLLTALFECDALLSTLDKPSETEWEVAHTDDVELQKAQQLCNAANLTPSTLKKAGTNASEFLARLCELCVSATKEAEHDRCRQLAHLIGAIRTSIPTDLMDIYRELIAAKIEPSETGAAKWFRCGGSEGTEKTKTKSPATDEHEQANETKKSTLWSVLKDPVSKDEAVDSFEEFVKCAASAWDTDGAILDWSEEVERPSTSTWWRVDFDGQRDNFQMERFFVGMIKRSYLQHAAADHAKIAQQQGVRTAKQNEADKRCSNGCCCSVEACGDKGCDQQKGAPGESSRKAKDSKPARQTLDGLLEVLRDLDGRAEGVDPCHLLRAFSGVLEEYGELEKELRSRVEKEAMGFVDSDETLLDAKPMSRTDTADVASEQGESPTCCARLFSPVKTRRSARKKLKMVQRERKAVQKYFIDKDKGLDLLTVVVPFIHVDETTDHERTEAIAMAAIGVCTQLVDDNEDGQRAFFEAEQKANGREYGSGSKFLGEMKNLLAYCAKSSRHGLSADALKLVQLLCENHHEGWQDYLRVQPNLMDRSMSVCIVSQCCKLLHAHVESMQTKLPRPGVLFVADKTGDKNTKRHTIASISLLTQLCDTLTELCQGPCAGNQKKVLEAESLSGGEKVLRCLPRILWFLTRRRAMEAEPMSSDTSATEHFLERQGAYSTSEKAVLCLLRAVLEGGDEDAARQLADIMDDRNNSVPDFQSIVEDNGTLSFRRGGDTVEEQLGPGTLVLLVNMNFHAVRGLRSKEALDIWQQKRTTTGYLKRCVLEFPILKPRARAKQLSQLYNEVMAEVGALTDTSTAPSLELPMLVRELVINWAHNI